MTKRNLVIGGVAALLVLLGVLALAAIPRPTATGRVALLPAQYVEQFPASTPHLLLDVRTPAEFAEGHIAGAVNIPVEQLSARLSEVPREGPVVVYCRSGNRSAQAAQMLTQAGYAPVYDLGGILAWEAEGRPVVR